MAAVHYQPGRFPPDGRLDWKELIPLVGPTAASVARYDGMLAALPNPDILLAPLTTREAVLSSRIEGTEATMGDVLQYEAGREPTSPSRRNDIREVLNYRAAMRRAEELMKTLPLSQRVVREAHKVLLHGARGEGKSPGEFRRTPVWIGAPGCTIEEARFVPVEAGALVPALTAWEKYLHSDAQDRLVQLAILHAEFEALHPFLDGNGRLGRMLVPLFLWHCGLIRAPRFYVSAYLEARRDAYYEGLLTVSRDDDWTGWCRFFLEAVRSQAEENLVKAQGIFDLYDKMKSSVAELTRSRFAIHALDWIFEYPIFNSSHFVERAGIPERSARRLLRLLHESEIVTVLIPGGGRRPTVFSYPAVLSIAEGREAS